MIRIPDDNSKMISDLNRVRNAVQRAVSESFAGEQDIAYANSLALRTMFESIAANMTAIRGINPSVPVFEVIANDACRAISQFAFRWFDQHVPIPPENDNATG